MNKKVALLSMNTLENFYSYDRLLIEPMKKLGWTTEEVSWRNESVNWDDFDAVVVRSTWDYQLSHEKFLSVLENINNSSAHLENNLELMKWNMNKNYLFDLEKKGVQIVKTIWEKGFNSTFAAEYFNKLNSEEIIIKPNISANADNTFRLNKENFSGHLPQLNKIFAQRQFMVQPFMQNIVEEGEYSLIYFNGEYSHSILKKPKEKDFRVQEEHGGIFKSVNPTQQLKSIAENIISNLSSIPLYGRTDFVRTSDNNFALMELELIEPSLYLNMDKESAERFAINFSKKMSSL